MGESTLTPCEYLLTYLSFGAVLEEFEVRDALMNALTGKTAKAVYMVGA